MEGSVIYEVANLDQIWVVLEAYEEDLYWIQPGDSIFFHTRANPGQQHEATVAWIDPVVDPDTRTVGIRADLVNHGNHFKPDMLVRSSLQREMDSKKGMGQDSSVLCPGPQYAFYVQATT